MAGPVAAIAALLLTNSPAPIIPPIEIMVMWRGCRERLSSGMRFPLKVCVMSSASRQRRVADRGRVRGLQQKRRQLRAQPRHRPAAGGPGDVHGGERLAVLAKNRCGDGQIAAITLLFRP